MHVGGYHTVGIDMMMIVILKYIAKLLVPRNHDHTDKIMLL